jgi:hypothetical protein
LVTIIYIKGTERSHTHGGAQDEQNVLQRKAELVHGTGWQAAAQFSLCPLAESTQSCTQEKGRKVEQGLLWMVV